MKKLAPTALAAGLVLTTAACDDGTIPPSHLTTFTVTVENVSTVYDFTRSGVFDTPVGEAGPGPLFPGASYDFTFEAGLGSYLTFATMFVQSNDWFYGPDGMGIPLFDAAGNPMTGDVTDYVYLWDAGTEEDQEPGLGSDQAPRQSGPDTGAADDDTTVRLAADDWGNIPETTDVIRVSLEYLGDYSFRAVIENVSDASTLMTSDGATHPVPMAPGVFVVHGGADPLYTVGADERGEGLEGIAEDGNTMMLAENVEARTGITSPIAPGVYAASPFPKVLFAEGDPDFGDGLEGLAEDGAVADLAAALDGRAGITTSGLFNTPDGAAGPGPVFPGQSYSFEVTATRRDRLHLATMYVQSNDLFFAPSEEGIDLFRGRRPLSGDITQYFELWDAGTEVNEIPGIGSNQAPRQAGPDTGEDEVHGTVINPNDGFSYPSVGEVIRVTITPSH